MSRSTRAAVIGLTAMVLAACGGGGSPEPEPKPEPVLERLKSSPDAPSVSITAPSDLGLPTTNGADELGREIGSNLTGILKTSFLAPRMWTATSDDDVALMIARQFRSLDDTPDFGAKFATALRESQVEGARAGWRLGSSFPSDAQPDEAYVFKVAYEAEVDGDDTVVRALAWAGYEVDGGFILMARQFQASGRYTDGGGSSYSLRLPSWVYQADTCAAVVDGVLVPSEDGLSDAAVDLLRREFADPAFTPLFEVGKELASVDGEAVGTDDEIDQEQEATTKECLADAA